MATGTYPAYRLRQAGVSAPRITAIEGTYNGWSASQQHQFRAWIASNPDETIRRTYDPDGPGYTPAGPDAPGASVIAYAPAPTGEDRGALQALVDGLPSSGGQVLLGPGAYVLSGAPLTLPSRVTLAGVGRGATVVRQSTAGTPAVVSRNWVSANGLTPLGDTAVRDLTIQGAPGGGAHGLVLRDYRCQVRNLGIDGCGGDGLLLTINDDTGAALPGWTLVENAFDQLIISNCGGYGFHGQSTGPHITDAFLSDIAVVGSGGTGGIYVESSAGWSVGHVHTYGAFTGAAVVLANAWNTWLRSAQVEYGWTGYGLLLGGVQRGLHLGDISVACNNTAGETAVHAEKSGANPLDGMTIDSLTVVQDNDQPVTAFSWDNPAAAVRIGALNPCGDHSARVLPVGGFGASAVRLVRDARVLGQLADNANATTLTYAGQPLAQGTPRNWEGAGPISTDFTVHVASYTSATGMLTVGSAQFNNGAQLTAYLGLVFLSAKASTDPWSATLNPALNVGFSAAPTLTVAGTGDTRTVTVTFTPASANGYGASCALFLAPQ
jgi:hypothetical protein